MDSLQKLGFEVTVEPDPAEECNRTITVVGRGGEIPAKKAELYVGNAGTAARFLTALVCLGHGEYTIHGDERMHERPMKELFEALRSLGARIEAKDDRLPAKIRAEGLRGGEITISAKRSSQFASALVLISRRCGPLGLSVKMTATKSEYRDEDYYFIMTSDMANGFFGDRAIEPDLSSASYFLAAGWIGRGDVRIAHCPQKSLQIDAHFPDYLPQLKDRNPLKASRVLHLGDSVMTLAVCSLFGKAPLHIEDASRLRVQETDRIQAMVTELRRVGAKAAEHEDGFTVWPAEPSQLHGADIETYNDHRMAMCFAVLGLKVPGIRIKNPGCVSKTFPNFFDKLEQLRT